jgi:hypothetical protein
MYPGKAFEDWLQAKQARFAANHEEAAVIDAVFFAGLEKDEGEPVRFQVVLADQGMDDLRKAVDVGEFADAEGLPERAWDVIEFVAKPPLEPKALAKLAVGTDSGDTAIVVEPNPDGSGLRIAGLARRNPRAEATNFLVVTARTPGSLTFEYGDDAFLEFTHGELGAPPPPLDRLRGPIAKALAATVPSLLAVPRPPFADNLYAVERTIVHLLRGIQDGQRGGILAILPRDATAEEKVAAKIVIASGDVLETRFRESTAADNARWKVIWDSVDGEGRLKGDATVQDLDSADAAREDATNDLVMTARSIGRLGAIDNALLFGANLQLVGAGYPIQVQATPAIQVWRLAILMGRSPVSTT